MELVSKTHVGLVRTENQDRVMTNHISTSCAYMILCDGMGGENAGSFASNTAINLVSDYINNQYSDYMDDDMVRNMLVRSVHEANSKLYFIAQRDYEKHGMGTTCVIAFIRKDKLHLVNVGDSRAYFILPNGIKRLTKDHNYVSQLIDDGIITPDEGKDHPHRNRITRAVGVFDEVIPDYFLLDFNDENILLICSDGLTSYCEEVDIAKIILDNSIEKASQKLIDLANKNGGFDNISVALAKL